MLTPPMRLAPDDLGRAIEDAWGFVVNSLDYRPVGFGSHHWVAQNNLGVRHFVTADELSTESRVGDEVSALGLHLRSALAAAIDLRALGGSFVVAPIATRAGDPFVLFDNYAVALFPFIEGQSFSFDASFGEADWEHVVEIVAALHAVPITAIRSPETDEFVVPWLDQLDRSMRHDAGSNGPHAAVASQLLIDNEVDIRRLIARYRTLVAQHRRDPGPVVITHGEIHPGNVMVSSDGWMIVDWDTVLIAPPERDLWRVAQGGRSALRTYAAATGVTPKGSLLDVYAMRWDLAEIASFAAEFRRPHEDTEDSRAALGLLRLVVERLRA